MCGIKGNQILFKQDSLVAVPPQLKEKMYIKSLMKILFYSVDGKVDKMAETVYGSPSIIARTKTLTKWFAVLDFVNPKYSISNTQVSRLIDIVEESLQEQKNHHDVVSNVDSLQFKSNLGSDVAAVQE